MLVTKGKLKARTELAVETMVALYKIKLKLNMSNKCLAAFCGQMEEMLIGETIYEVAICHFQISCQIPRKWLNPKMSDEDKDVIFNHFLSMQDPIYTQHLAPMKDPTGKLNLNFSGVG